MTDTMVIRIAQRVSLMFTGLFTGFVVAVLVLETSLRSYDLHVYTQVRQVELDSLDTLASATLLPALISTALLLAFRFTSRGRTFWLNLIALALLLAIFALTLVINLPINADQLTWRVQAPPMNWANIRDRWQIAHALRTSAAVIAFVSLITAATRKATRT
ncbi:anthrone oxygenase family protein [Nonomuraea sp. NPDC002799]